MQRHEITECVQQLQELFPRADFSGGEFSLIHDEIKRFHRDDAMDAIRVHRMNSEKPQPSLKVLMAMMIERSKKRPASQQARRENQYATVIAQGIARENPNLAGRPEAELILRYYRFWLCRYRKDADARKGDTTGPGAERINQFTANREAASVRECATELSAIMDAEKAEAFAQCIALSQHEFNLYLSDLENVPTQADVMEAFA